MYICAMNIKRNIGIWNTAVEMDRGKEAIISM